MTLTQKLIKIHNDFEDLYTSRFLAKRDFNKIFENYFVFLENFSQIFS